MKIVTYCKIIYSKQTRVHYNFTPHICIIPIYYCVMYMHCCNGVVTFLFSYFTCIIVNLRITTYQIENRDPRRLFKQEKISFSEDFTRMVLQARTETLIRKKKVKSTSRKRICITSSSTCV